MRNDDDGSSLRQRSRQGSAASLRPSRASTSSSTNPQSSSNSNSKLRDLSSESTLTDHAETMEEGASSIEAPTVPFLDKGDLPPIPPSPTDSFSFLTSQSSRGAEDLKADAFQQRRKRAEKLSSFFGVDYRELFTEVLDVIESEVRSDSIHGNLSPEETQVRRASFESVVFNSLTCSIIFCLGSLDQASEAQKDLKDLIALFLDNPFCRPSSFYDRL